MAASSAPLEGSEKVANTPHTRPTFASLASNRAGIDDFAVQAKISTRDGIPMVTFESNDLARAAFGYRFALVMKFAFSQRPSVEIIRSTVINKWGLQALVSILDSRHVLLKFNSESDIVKVLSRESNRIDGVFYKIFRWSPDFDPKHDASLAPIWVQLKDLPVHMYVPSILKNISRPIGQYLKSDNATITMSNTTRARFCAEVDLTRALPEKIATNSSKTKVIVQPVFYEFIPSFCIHCRIQGHCATNCNKSNSELKKKKANSGHRQQPNNNEDQDGEAHGEDDGDGGRNVASKDTFLAPTHKEVICGKEDNQGTLQVLDVVPHRENSGNQNALQVFDPVLETNETTDLNSIRDDSELNVSNGAKEKVSISNQFEILATVEDGEVILSNTKKDFAPTMALDNAMELGEDNNAIKSLEKMCGTLQDQTPKQVSNDRGIMPSQQWEDLVENIEDGSDIVVVDTPQAAPITTGCEHDGIARKVNLHRGTLSSELFVDLNLNSSDLEHNPETVKLVDSLHSPKTIVHTNTTSEEVQIASETQIQGNRWATMVEEGQHGEASVEATLEQGANLITKDDSPSSRLQEEANLILRMMKNKGKKAKKITPTAMVTRAKDPDISPSF